MIQRNILENPGWYTAYTPYQAEIAQGRLEALLNFQTMVTDLTALDIANASLLDEGTAAAEAMTLCHAAVATAETHFFVANNAIRRRSRSCKRARSRSASKSWSAISRSFNSTRPFSALSSNIPRPTARFSITSLSPSSPRRRRAPRRRGRFLALTLLKPPGEFGADVAVGSTQRFGVPLGFGGPHAAYFATRDAYKRHMPGRLVGVSHDATGRPGYRLALQTREQHIRRDKATSNICTAQVLLAVIASMYAVYHGPRGLRAIAESVHDLASQLRRISAISRASRSRTRIFSTRYASSWLTKTQTPIHVTRAPKAGMQSARLDQRRGRHFADETTTRKRPGDSLSDLQGGTCRPRSAIESCVQIPKFAPTSRTTSLIRSSTPTTPRPRCCAISAGSSRAIFRSRLR